MTTNNQLAPPSEDSIETLEQPEEKSEDTQEVIDLKVRVETAESGLQKLENDLKAERGRRTRDQLMGEMAADLGGVKAQLTAIAKRTASGETEALTEDFAKIDQASSARQTLRSWESNCQEAEQSLAEAVMDDEDNVLLDKETIARLNISWQEAQKNHDLHALYRVVSQAGKEARLAEKQKAHEDITKTEEDAKAAKKASDTKHGINDLSIPAPSGIGGSGKSWTQAQKITKLSELSDEDYAKLIT